MTSTRIEEIRQRAEAATPGEWTEERPTVADLEQLLREDDTPVRITPDGRVVPAAPASPEKDEPVAWLTRNSAGQWISTTVALVASEWEKSAEPVYPLFTAPPSLADAVAALKDIAAKSAKPAPTSSMPDRKVLDWVHGKALAALAKAGAAAMSGLDDDFPNTGVGRRSPGGFRASSSSPGGMVLVPEHIKRLALTAAAVALREHGMDISLPWEGDLDDLERERYEGLVTACECYAAAISPGEWQDIASDFPPNKYRPGEEPINQGALAERLRRYAGWPETGKLLATDLNQAADLIDPRPTTGPAPSQENPQGNEEER